MRSPMKIRGKNLSTTDQPFPNHRAAALALLNNAPPRNRKTGGFLGQIAVDPAPLTAKQADWLATLLERASLPSIIDGAVS